MKPTRIAAMLLVLCAAHAHAADLFPLRDVRLGPSPFLDAQTTDLNYLMAMEADRLLAPFLREAGLPLKQPGYGNWESSGLDGHMGGHYLSALALMFASTGDAAVKERLDYFVAELKRAQQANGDGYLGGIPGGRAAWRDVAAGKLHADNFSVNGKWVPWYNLHKIYAGLRDAWRYAGNEDAKAMLVALSDWSLRLTSRLSDAQMQSMLRSEHGGMNEVLADVAAMTGDARYMALALKFSHQAILQPLEQHEDKLTGLHANTQIPKVIGFQRIGELTNDKAMQQAAAFFWQTVVEHRTVAIGGNSVKEHFHDAANFAPMVDEVEGPETCNTYNMLKLTELLFARATRRRTRITTSARCTTTSSAPSIRAAAASSTSRRCGRTTTACIRRWTRACGAASAPASRATPSTGNSSMRTRRCLFVNLFIPSTLDWRAKGVRLTQSNRFPDQATTRIVVDGDARFTLKIRYPAWVAPGSAGRARERQGGPHRCEAGQLRECRTHVEEGRPRRRQPADDDAPGADAGQVELLCGAARSHRAGGQDRSLPERALNFLADDSRMGHIAAGQVCPLEAAPTFVSDTTRTSCAASSR
jgi:DUF1680 family protein